MDWNGWIWSLGLLKIGERPGPKGNSESFPRDHVDMKGWVRVIWKSDGERQKGTGDKEATKRYMWHSLSNPDSDWGLWRTECKEILSPFPVFGKSCCVIHRPLFRGVPHFVLGQVFFRVKIFQFLRMKTGVSLREAPGMYQNPLLAYLA